MLSRGTGAHTDRARGGVGERDCPRPASRVPGRRAGPKLRVCSLAPKMPTRCVWPGRSRRGVRRPRARRWGARTPRGRGAGRQARSLVRGARCGSAARLRDARQPLGRRRAAEPAAFRGANEALGTPGNAGSTEAARDPRAVWVNGAVGEPEVVGPAGSVWVTKSAGEEADDRSPRLCERKGRPGALGHESILELWLKVQAMRVASGCWEGSRVALHPVPAGEGPVEKGVPGQASWVETSRGGVTGPWVRGHARAFSRIPGLPTASGLGAGCVRALGFCRQGHAGRAPPAVRGPGAVAETGCAVASGQTGTMPEATMWPEAVGRAAAREVERGCGGAPGSYGVGQPLQVSGALAQDAVYGVTPGLWGKGQVSGGPETLMVPRAMELENPPLGAPGMWQTRQEVKDTGSGGVPGLWVIEQPLGVPCANEEGPRCGGDPGSWGTAQTVEVSSSGEQEAGSPGVQGLWDIEQAMAAPKALGKEADNAGVPGLWGTGQLPRMSQVVALSGDRGAETSYDGIPGLWERQQDLGAPLAETVPGLVVEETHSGSVLSLWERRQVTREQEAQGPAALGTAEPVDQDATCGALPCFCGRRHTLGVSETVMMPKHRCAPEGVPMALGVPAAMWVPDPVCQESCSRDDLNFKDRAYAAQMPVGSRRPLASEECPSVVDNTDSEALPGSWGRRLTVGVPMVPEVSGCLEVEPGSRGFSDLSRRRQTSGIPVTVGVSTTVEPVAPRAPGSLLEQTASGRVSALAGSRPSVGISMAVGLPELMRENTLSEGLQRRQAAGMPMAARVAMSVGVPPVVDGGCGEGAKAWQRTQMTEVPTASRVPRLEGEAGSEGVSGVWRRNSGTIPEVVGETLPQGMLTAVGVPMARRVPAAVWVTGSPGEEALEGFSDLTMVRRQSTEGTGSSGEQIGSRGILELITRGQAVGVTYTHECGARLWDSPRSVEEETAYENVSRMSGTRTPMPLVSREETGVGRFRDHLQQNGRRPVGEVPGIRGRGNDLGEERLRGAFH
uniref:RIKEN cDNA 4933427D14 gene n=1 Tax=Nannospalax galili TaxID=1026970 RepID=A0A8C6W7W9_NANGA